MSKPFYSVSAWAQENNLSYASIFKMAKRQKKTWLKVGDEYVVSDLSELEALLEAERDHQRAQTLARRQRAKDAAQARKDKAAGGKAESFEKK